MKSIRNLWWIGALALIAACDPYDDESKGPPSIISAFASNQSDVSEGELVDGAWTMTSSTVCTETHQAARGVVPRGKEVPEATIADIPVIYVKTNKLLDGNSIQADPLSCEQALRDGAPWLTITRTVGSGTPEDVSDGWLTCYNPSSPTSSEGASIIIYPGSDVTTGVEGEGWFAGAEAEGDSAEVTTYRIQGTAFDKQGNPLDVNVAFELEPDTGPVKSFRPTEITPGTGDAVTATFTFTPGSCGTATKYVVQKVTGEDADGKPIWTAVEGATFDVADPPATSYTFTDGTLKAGEVADYRVRATIPGAGEGFTETAAEYTLTALPIPTDAPTAQFLAASGTGDAAKPNRIAVDYATALPADATAYAVLRAAEDESIVTEDQPGAFSVVAPEVGLATSTSTTKFPFEDKKLGGCQLYFYAVAAVDADGNVGPYGPPSAGVKSPVGKVGAPTLEKAETAGVKVTWGLVRGATAYQVQRAPDDAGNPGTFADLGSPIPQPTADQKDPTKPATKWSITDAEAAAGATWHYRVRITGSDPTLCSDVVTTSNGTPAFIRL